MAEHTSTPWEIGSHNRRGILKDAAGIADGCDSYMVAVTSAHSLVSADEAAANAAFIVKAVNNHEALVKALEEISQLKAEDMYLADDSDNMAALIARKALAGVGTSQVRADHG